LSSNTSPPKEFHSISLKVAAPKAIIKKSFTYDPFYKFCICWCHPFSFLYHILYDVKEHVTLYHCEPLHGQYCKFLNF
jgi:hypothetical protein